MWGRNDKYITLGVKYIDYGSRAMYTLRRSGKMLI